MATGRPVFSRTSRPAPIPANVGCRYGASSSPTRASSTTLRDRIRFIRQAIVKRMELMYRPELEVLSAEERRDLLIALEALIDFESWGADARGSWPVVRRGMFGVGAHDRPHAAADASSPPMSRTDTPPRPARVDGRRLRSERTKQLIIEAYLALAQENSPQVPTAAEIAHRAGYSVRSVFERFPDIRTLQVAAVDYALVQVAALAPARDSHGDRATRIKTQVETRGQSCERWLPLWRSLVANQGDSPELKQRIVLSRERVVARLEFMYAPELSTLPETERRHVLIVLESLTDVESWARMREFFGLSFEEACLAWRQAIDRLLPPTPSA